jgi:hypothetical protein
MAADPIDVGLRCGFFFLRQHKPAFNSRGDVPTSELNRFRHISSVDPKIITLR